MDGASPPGGPSGIRAQGARRRGTAAKTDEARDSTMHPPPIRPDAGGAGGGGGGGFGRIGLGNVMLQPYESPRKGKTASAPVPTSQRMWWHDHPFVATALFPFVLFFWFCCMGFLAMWWIFGIVSMLRFHWFLILETITWAALILFTTYTTPNRMNPLARFAFDTSLIDILLFQGFQIVLLVGFRLSFMCCYPSEDARYRLSTIAFALALLSMSYTIFKSVTYCWSATCRDDEWMTPRVAMAVLILSVLAPFQRYAILSLFWRPVTRQQLKDAEHRLLVAAVPGNLETESRMFAGLHTIIVKERDGSHVHKPPLVLCHGWASGAGFWYPTFQYLAPHFRVFAVDWRGCGGSERPPFVAKTPLEAEDFFIDSLEAWRQTMVRQGFLPSEEDHRPFSLCGHSLGGYLSTAYTIKYPENVDHLYLVSPVGLVAPKSPKSKHTFLSGLVRWLWDWDMTPQSLIRFMGPVGPQLAAAVVQRRLATLKLQLKVPLAHLTGYLYQLTAMDGSGEFALSALLLPGAWAKLPVGPRLLEQAQLGRFKGHLTLLFGDGDWTSFSHGSWLASSMTSLGCESLCLRVSNAGHLLFFENPYEFSSKLVAAGHRARDIAY